MTKTCKPTIAGVLNIVSATLLLVGGITILGSLNHPNADLWANYIMFSVGQSDMLGSSLVTTITIVSGIALIVPGVLSLLGGIYSVKRRMWGLALAGSISTFVSTFFVGIPAIILTALSRNEFASRQG